MATVTANFTASGSTSSCIFCARGDAFDWAVTGTWTGDWILESTRDNAMTWNTEKTGTANDSGTLRNEDSGWAGRQYRFRAGDVDSGTMAISLADKASDVLDQGQTLWENKEGDAVLEIMEDGIHTTGVTLPGLSANQLVKTSATSSLTTVGALTNGQIMVGSTGVAPVAATITATANETEVTNGAGSITIGLPDNVTVVSSVTITGLTANGVVSTDASSKLASTALTNGQILLGSTGAAPVAATLTATANETEITNAAGSVTIGLPDNVTITSGVTISGLTANGVVSTSAASKLASTALTDGQLLIGSTGAAPVAATITATANETTVTNGAGTITIGLPDNVTIVSGATISGNTANAFLYSNATSKVASTAAPTNGQLLIGSTGGPPVVASITGTANEVTVTDGPGSIALSLPANVIVSGVAISTNTASAMLYSDATSNIKSTVAPTNGQILIGSTGANPVLATLTGTANEVTVTNGAGTITLSLPPAITVSGATISTNTAKAFIYSDASSAIKTTAAPTDGQLLIGSTGNVPAVAAITADAGSDITVTNGAGTIALDHGTKNGAQGNFTRAATDGAGTQWVSGVSHIGSYYKHFAFHAVDDGAAGTFSRGNDDGTQAECMYVVNADGHALSSVTDSIHVQNAASGYTGSISAFGTDKFSVDFALVGGGRDITVYWQCWR